MVFTVNLTKSYKELSQDFNYKCMLKSPIFLWSNLCSIEKRNYIKDIKIENADIQKKKKKKFQHFNKFQNISTNFV